MLSLTRFKCNFIANWRFALLAAFFCLLFVQLGLWQLKRGDEKKQMQESQHRLMLQAPIDFPLGSAESPIQYQPVHVEGRFLNVNLLLDNQHYQHQFGYNVISPFMLANGQVVLIDRGWIPAGASREELPEITIPLGQLELEGSVYYPSQKSWSLGTFFDKKQANNVVIELIDARIISQFLHKSVYPFIIRMRAEEPNGFIREWQVVSMPPERHKAYAVQWFAMALVIVILFIVLNIKKKI